MSSKASGCRWSINRHGDTGEVIGHGCFSGTSLAGCVVNGVALGWIYVLMALGLTLIFGIMHIMQFAHGEIYMLGAYVVYYLTAFYKLPLIPAAALSMVCMAATGVFLERVLFRQLKGDMLAAVVATLGLTLIIQSGAVAAFGLYERSIPVLAQGPPSFRGYRGSQRSGGGGSGGGYSQSGAVCFS